jgi:hypothetical protein
MLRALTPSSRARSLAVTPGFVRRELLRGGNGQWVDLVWWENRAAADAVIGAVGASALCHSYFELMVGADAQDPGAGVLHLHRVRVY